MTSVPSLPALRRLPLALSLAGALALAATAPAQIQVRYGDPVQSGTIKSANQTHHFLLMGAKQGDTLRIVFTSQHTGWPNYWYYNRLDVRDGAKTIGSIDGVGVLTMTLPKTAIYTIDVRARDNQATGWYAFKLDRMNAPVGADRTAFNWNMKGSISSAAGFHVYTLRAVKGSSALLRFTCQHSGWPNYYYYHYAELLDSKGKRVAAVTGNGATPITFAADGIYTLFVAARDYASGGWFAASLECRSWPSTPCDCQAYSGNYGQGSRGTNGVPTLTATALPKLGGTTGIDVGNSSGKQTTALVMIGIDAANVPFTPLGGTLLVAPTAMHTIPLPGDGLKVNFPLPNDPLLCGLGLAVQTVQIDPGAKPAQLAFSPGLMLLIGR